MEILKKIVALIIVSMFIVGCGNESNSDIDNSDNSNMVKSDKGP